MDDERSASSLEGDTDATMSGQGYGSGFGQRGIYPLAAHKRVYLELIESYRWTIQFHLLNQCIKGARDVFFAEDRFVAATGVLFRATGCLPRGCCARRYERWARK